MKIVAVVAAIVGATAVVAALFFVLYGRERTWELLSGPNDPGRYDFAKALRRSTGNDALACSPGLCAEPDMALPTYDLAPGTLIDRLAGHMTETDSRARRVDDRADPAYARFLTFSPVMRFPDAIDIEAAPANDGRTGLRIYSRAKLGSKDFGKNREHIERLMADFAP